jgi:hypothetical protein
MSWEYAFFIFKEREWERKRERERGREREKQRCPLQQLGAPTVPSAVILESF